MSSQIRDVAFWHKAEVPPTSRDFRFRGLNGHPMSAFLRSWSVMQRWSPASGSVEALRLKIPAGRKYLQTYPRPSDPCHSVLVICSRGAPGYSVGPAEQGCRVQPPRRVHVRLAVDVQAASHALKPRHDRSMAQDLVGSGASRPPQDTGPGRGGPDGLPKKLE